MVGVEVDIGVKVPVAEFVGALVDVSVGALVFE